MNEQLLKDFVATAEYHNYDWETIFSKFPELQGYDQQALKDYVATAKYNNYDFATTNSKFPEFNQAPQQEESGILNTIATYAKGVKDYFMGSDEEDVKKKEEQGSTELPSEESSLASPSKPETATQINGQINTQTQTPNFFAELLNSITPELIDEDEDDIEDKLGKKLEPYGVKVEQDKRFREAIKLSIGEEGSPDYKEISVPVDNFFADNDKKSSIDLKKWLAENTNKEKIAEQESVASEFQKATVNEQAFNKALGGINADLISQDDESIVPQLTAMFGNYGIGDKKFKFEEVGVTDNIKVTAPNGKVFVTEVDAFTTKGDEKIAADLKKFMEDNKPVLLKAEDNLNKYATTFLSEKEMEDATKSFSIEADNFKNEVNSALYEKKILESGKGKMSPEEYNQRTQALNEKIAKISEKENQLNSNKLMLDKSLAKYVEWKSEQGGVVSSIVTSLIGVPEGVSGGILNLFNDAMIGIAPVEFSVGAQDYRQRFLKASFEEGVEVPYDIMDLNQYKISDANEIKFNKWLESLPEDVREKVDDKIKDETKKKMKKDIIYPSTEIINKGYRELVGTSPEYIEKAQKTTVLQSGLMGVAGSLPAIGGGVYGFALMGLNGTMKEMSGEGFEDISENEKYLVAVPVAILNGVLEEYGLRNLIGKSSVTTSILSNVMGKAGKKATASTFKELVENEVESRLSRGLLTLGAAGLAEAETGGMQQLGELAIKDIYNQAKEKELFQTPNGLSGWVDEIGESARQEAIGGMIMGSIGAVSTAASANNYNGISDKTLKQLELLRDDETFRSAFVANLKYDIASGKKTKEQAEAELDGYNKSISLYNQIPTDITDAAKRKAFGLLAEKTDLESKIQGKDESLTKKDRERIAEIKNELSKLPEMIEEGAASYSVNGEQMSEEDFAEVVGNMTADEIKSADIKATNASESVTNLLKDVATRSGVESAPMMETTAPQEKIALSSNKKMGDLSEELQNEIDESGLISYGEIGDIAENKSVVEALDNKIDYHQSLLERENEKDNPDESVVNQNTNALKTLNDLKAKVEQENIAVSPAEAAAAEAAAKAKSPAKPKTLDKIEEGEVRDFLLSELEFYENPLKGRKKRLDELVEKKPSILKPIAKLSRAIVERLPISENKRYGKLKEKVEQIKTNPEQFINDEIERYEKYKEDEGEDFEYQPFLDKLYDLQSKLQEQNAIQEPTTKEGVLRTEQSQVGLPTMGQGNTQQATTQEGVALAKQKEDIERRRKESLQTSPIISDNGYERTFNYGEENEFTIVGDSNQDYYDKINAKYDAELAELEKQSEAKLQEVKPIEQELTELEQMFPEEGPTGENRGVAASNTQAMDEMHSRATDERVQKVIRTAQRLTKTLKSLIPTADIHLHETDDSYNGAMEQLNGNKNSDGYFIMGKNADGKSVVRIDINLSRATPVVVAHEVAHVILQKAFGNNQKLFQSFQEKIAKVLSTDSNQQLLDFANQDAYKEEGVTYEEYMVQLKALLSEQGVKLELSTAKKIAAVINEYVSRITKGAFKPFQEVTDVKQVIDFVNKVTEAMAKGEAIDVEGISNVGEGTISRASIKNIDVNKIRTLSRAGNRVSKGLAIKVVKNQKVVEEAEELSLEYVKEKAPELFIKNADLISKYPIIQGIKKFGEIKNMQDAQEVYDIFTRQIADNLKYLMDNFKKEFRDIATLWYDGANILAQNFSKKYGISTEQAAGIIASLSPQKDWYQNVRLAEMVMMAFKENPVMTQEMVDKQKSIRDQGFKEYDKKLKKAQLAYKKSRSKANAEKLKKQIEKNEKYNKKTEIILEKISNLIGSDMNSVPPEMKGYYVRLFHEINTTKDYDVLSPDGSVIGIAKNDDGKNSKVAWGSYTEIGKAVSIYLDGSQENITRTLGEMHKIRNFYNNIIDPMSPDKDVTMDTHAVAAALMLPLSGNTKQVEANFGTGTSNSAPLGIKGLYYAYAEGYNLAAEEAGLLPRQIQSITWEAVRGLFTDKFKTSKKNIEGINQIVENYVNKQITLDEARNQITEYAGGIKDPSWAGGPIQEESTDNVKRGADGRGSRGDGPDTVGAKRRGKGGVISRSSLRVEQTTKALDNILNDFYTSTGKDFADGTPNESRSSYAKMRHAKNRLEKKLGFDIGNIPNLSELQKQIKNSLNYLTRKLGYNGEFSNTTELSEAYQKAKTDGSNPELVKAVDDLISNVISRSSLKTDSEIDNVVKQARASGYSEKAIEEFLKKRGVAQEKIDKSLGKKEAGTKIVTNEEMMPGYDRMMAQVDNIIEKGLNRNTNQKNILDNVISYIQGSKAYENATAQQQEEIIRDVKKAFGEKMKSAPSAQKVLGLKENIKQITMALSKYHQQRYEDMEKAEANKEKAIKKASKELVASLKGLVRKGQISTKQMAAVLRKFVKTNVLSKSSVKEFTDYMSKVFADADYANKLSEARTLKKIISKASKNKSLNYDANLVKLAVEFKKIDPAMVEDIDQYNKMASQLKEAIKGSKAIGAKVKFANTVKISEFNDYVEATLESQKEKIIEELRQQVQDLLGIDASTLSYQELIDKLNETGEVDLSKENEEAVRVAVGDMFKVYSDAINSMLSSDVDIKESKIELVKRFMKMDISKMKIKDAIYAVDALNNFMVNGSTAKMEKVLNEYEGQQVGDVLLKKKIKADVPKIYRTKWGARNLIRYFLTVPMMIENFFKGKRAQIFESETGIRDLISHKSQAQRIVNVILKNYTDTFYKLKPNKQAFNTAFNNIERNMLAYVTRAKVGQEAQSFKDRKSLIDQSIKNLKEGDEKQQKKAELYQQVFDKILKDSKNAQEVMDKVDPINAKAFNYWVDVWSNFYEELADVSENIHNKILGKDMFYTPDKVSRLEPEEQKELGEDMTASAFHTNSGVVYKKKTGRLEESTLKDKLPDGSYIDLSFDNNNANLLLDALVDIKTAGDVAKLNAFLKSDSFKKVFPNAEIRKVFVSRMNTMVRNFRNKNHFQDNEARVFSKFINRIGGLSSAAALTSGFQLLKQTISVGGNTLINAGIPHLAYRLNKAKFDFINNSGEAIANRGAESQADINAIDSLIKQAAESKGEKALQFIEEINKRYLSVFLKHPDIWIAKASWMAYYEKGLRRQGIKTKNINYSDHKLNKEAAQYAQRMVDRQQNISDADLKGEFFSSKNALAMLFSKIFFPLASFRINAWARMNLDLRTIFNKNVSLQDREDAIRSLAGGVVESVIFNAIGISATGWMYGYAMDKIRGADDDDEDKEKQRERDEKYADSILKGRFSQFSNDLTSPLPITDWLAETVVFETLDLIQELKGIKEDDRLNIFEPPDIDEPQKMSKYFGAFGISIERLNESRKIIQAATTGKIKEKKFGQETVRYVDPKDKEMLSKIAMLSVLNASLLLPVDAYNYQRNIFREISKQASTKTEAELIEDKANKRERIANKNEKIDLIDQALRKAPNQRVADELVKMRNDAIEDLSTEKKSDEEKEALKKKREREKAEYKNLLGGYDTKEDLKRYDPDLYEDNFGEGSDYYKTHKYEQEAEKLLDKVERKNKDIEYNYEEPTKTKSRFFNSDGTTKRKSHFKRFSSK